MIVKEAKIQVTSPADVAEILQATLKAEGDGADKQEHFWVIGMNSKHIIEYIDLVALGGLKSQIIEPRCIFRAACSRMIEGIIIAHNHPSGDTTPSDQDKKTTAAIKSGGDLLGITVLDHIIIGIVDDCYYSYQEDGRI
jgi:DNA repair protein RadC